MRHTQLVVNEQQSVEKSFEIEVECAVQRICSIRAAQRFTKTVKGREAAQRLIEFIGKQRDLLFIVQETNPEPVVSLLEIITNQIQYRLIAPRVTGEQLVAAHTRDHDFDVAADHLRRA